jgi:hypothetical protein
MKTRSFAIQDELEKNHYVEFQVDQRKRSVMINCSSNGNNTSVLVDIVKLRKAMEELNG